LGYRISKPISGEKEDGHYLELSTLENKIGIRRSSPGSARKGMQSFT
jgi:hypothetical protein